jgi:hypothetical protein
MYRDAATSLDEHDRAIGAILIGETLVAQCERLVAVIHDPHAPERWRAMRDIHDDYPEIWRHLDRAKSVLASRGVNTIGYDELRPHVRPSLAAVPDGREQAIDPDALDDARRAIDELKLSVHGADWSAIDKRTRGLVETPQLRTWNRLALAGFMMLCALAVLSWFIAITPVRKPDRTEAMRKELAEIAEQRRVRINMLSIAIGERCDPPIAHELTRLLVMDGRGADAERFADVYIARCGADTVVENWANAPRPPR